MLRSLGRGIERWGEKRIGAQEVPTGLLWKGEEKKEPDLVLPLKAGKKERYHYYALPFNIIIDIRAVEGDIIKIYQ